jgi:hypothetical protein
MLVIREGKPPVLVRTGLEPYQICFLGAMATWGTQSLFTLSSLSTTTTRSIPSAGAYVFFAVLAAGSLMVVTGVFYEVVLKKILGFTIERAGLYVLMGLCSAYAVWAGAASGSRALAFIYFMAAMFLGSAWRALRIRKDLREVARGGGS